MIKRINKAFFKRFFLYLVITWGISFSFIQISSRWVSLGINGTDSLPGKIFLILKNRTPLKGELAAFYPPESARVNKRLWFVKYVKGVGGDIFRIIEKQIYINGDYLGKCKLLSLDGEPLVPSDNLSIPKDYYFMWSPHQDSYDSRYKNIGIISKDRIIGTAIRLI